MEDILNQIKLPRDLEKARYRARTWERRQELIRQAGSEPASALAAHSQTPRRLDLKRKDCESRKE